MIHVFKLTIHLGLFALHLFYRQRCHLLIRADSPALCSANLAPILSECFKNLSVQFCTHVFWDSAIAPYCSSSVLCIAIVVISSQASRRYSISNFSCRPTPCCKSEQRWRMVLKHKLTSLVDNDLEVKSWAQAMKHFSTRPEYSRIKSPIWVSVSSR